jgi:hypothetical protein
MFCGKAEDPGVSYSIPFGLTSRNKLLERDRNFWMIDADPFFRTWTYVGERRSPGDAKHVRTNELKRGQKAVDNDGELKPHGKV